MISKIPSLIIICIIFYSFNTSSKIITVTSNVNKIGPHVNEIRSGLLNANTDKIKTNAKVVTIAEIIILLSVIERYNG